MKTILTLAVVGMFGCAAVDTDPGSSEEAGSSELKPNGRGETKGWAKVNGGGHSSGIDYHGGPVFTVDANVYYIFYGTWSASSQQILTDLANGLNGSPWFGINKTYYDGKGAHVTGGDKLAGTTTDAYSQGTTIADASKVVTTAIAAGKLPLDANGAYFVIASKDVHEGQFCSQYCGYHDNVLVGSTQVKYAFIGDGDQCPSGCLEQTNSPNGDSGADGAASIIGHELSETVTDPLGTAWYDRRGYENADKCAWTFGATKKAANGSLYNVTLGGRNYLIQQNWVNSGSGGCALQ